MPEFKNKHFCPVNSFNTYLELLYPDVDFLWQAPKYFNYYDSTEVHFGPGRVGHNLLDDYVNRICKLNKIDKNYTNHSLQCTGVITLKRAYYIDK